MFEYKGGQYTYEDLQLEAKKQGVEFSDFMGKMKRLGMVYKSNAPDKGLNLDMSSQQPFGQDDGFDDDMSIMQGLKNFFGTNLQNVLTKKVLDIKGSAAAFFEDFNPDIGQAIIGDDGKDRGAMGLIDPETGKLVTMDEDAWRSKGYDAQENKRWNELVERRDKLKHPRHWKNLGYNSLGEFEKSEDGSELMALEYFYENGEKTSTVFAEAAQKNLYKGLEAVEGNLRTLDKGITGFTDALKKGQIDDMFVQSIDFLTNTTIDMGAAYLSRGTTMMAQMYGAGYTTYNDEKSKLLYGEDDPDRFKKLIENDEDEMAIPGLLSAVGYVMERAGYKGITKEIMKKSFGGKKALNLFIAGNKEGLTEYGQGLTERLNENLGKGMSLEDGVADVGRYMGTEEAWDQYFAGLIGGGGLATGGSIVQGALRSDENSNIFINKTINNIAGLNELRHRTSNKKEQKRLLGLIQIEQTNLKDFLQTNKDLSDYLVEGEVDILTDLVNNRRDVTSDVVKLQNLFKRNKISEQSYGDQARVLKDKLADLDSDLKMIKENANMRLLKSDLDAGSKFLGNVDGLEQDVYDTPEEFFKALEQEYKALGKEMPNFEGVNIHGLKIGKKFLINAKIAAEVNAVATSTHEVLHGIVKSTVQADDGSGLLSANGVKIVKSFINQLSSKEKGLIEGLLKSGKYKVNKDGTDKDFKEYGEEYLTMYAQLAKEGRFTKNNIQKAGIWFGRFFNKETEFKKISFKDGKSTRAFLDAYAGGNKVALEQSVALAKEGVKMKETPEQFSKDSKGPVDDLGKMGWNDKTWKESGATFAIETMKDEKLLDALIYSKYKVEDVPANFVDLVYAELVKDVQKFNEGKWGTKDENNSLFGYLQGRIKFRAGDVYNREFKVDDAMKGAKDIGKTTKEGEVKVQVAAEKSAEMEAFEEEDLSIQGQAKKAKADKQRYSEYRRKLGFETGSKIYNEVLDNVKKSLMMAYGTTQNIEDAQLRAKAIATKLKKEYANLNSPLFKQIKNFLTYGVADVYVKRGTKDIYISNLKKFREDIVKNTSTADLVQMERNTPEADRIFTNFVKVLTSIEQVQDAVNKEQLPPEALNKITKDKKTGKGAFSPSLYNKIMPTETELISWADQPGINPVTGLRQGLKGTRKDGIAMRMVNGLVTDAIMEARQSEEVQNKIANMDVDPGSVAELGAAIGREVNVKFSKSNAIGDVSAAIDGAGDVNVYSQIKFSKSHREAYEKQLTKKRPDLTEDQRKNAVQSVFDFVDGKEIPNHKKSKYEKMAMHYTANGFLILPEDGYKVVEAERLATQKKIDPFSFKNPNVLIETYVGEVKGTRTNPDKVKTFSNKTQFAGGVTVYNVEDSKQGQRDTRTVIDTHFGKESNPWCLCARDQRTDQAFGSFVTKAEAKQFADEYKAKGWETEIIYAEYSSEYEVYADLMGDKKTELNNAFKLWKDYNKDGNGHQIAFQNGRLVAFRDGKKEPQWWDRNDNPTSGVVVRGKKVKDGFKEVIEVNKTKETLLYYEKVLGDKKNGTTIRKDLDGNLVFQETKKNGKTDGLNIEVDNKNKKSNDYNSKRTQNFKEGNRLNFKEERTYSNPKATETVSFGKDEVRVDNITKHERSFTEKDWTMQAETITIEGTVNQKYFKEFQDPSSVTGWEKTNLPYLTPTHERYYSIQGKKVKIVKTTKNEGKTDYRGTDVTVTIDGVVQETNVRFSKSDVKFSLTKLEVDRKLGPYLAKQLKDATSLEQQAFWSGIQELTGKGVPVAEAYNTVAQKVKNQHGVEVIGIKQLDDNVKNYYLPKIREAAKEFSVDWYKDQLKEVKGDIKAELDIINDYMINVGRPIRSGMVYNITSNKKLMNDVYKQFGNKYKAYYELVPTNNGQKVMFRTKEGGELQNINLYQDITAIKSNPKQYWSKIDEQSVKARNWLNKLLDSKQSDGIKKAIIQLTSYGQRSPIRKLSKAGVFVEGLPTLETTLEHEITVNDIHSAIIDHIDGKIDRAELNKLLDKAYVHVLPNKIDNILKAADKTSNRDGRGYESVPKAMDFLEKLNQAKKLKGNTDLFKFSKSDNFQKLDKAIQFSRSANNPTKGITVLDFDDTLATSKSMIRFTRPDGTKGKLNAEQYASTYQDLSELGYKWDFSEFNKVVDGKTAPLFNKAMKLQGKFGPENMFVLTARPAESATAIHAFLKANGLNIPLKNITGLANSTSEAKALWIADKVGEGYNDFYFADDALQNVQAVKNMLDQFDVKSKVQQARVKFSKNMNTEFNKVLERTTGVNANEIISGARAAKRGASKGKYKFFVPPSADDFKGLLYYFVGKGKQGEKDMAFLKKALTDPLNRAYTEFNAARQSIANDYRNLKKQMPDVKKKLLQKTPDGDFTYGDAVRVYLWNKAGFDVPGLNQKDVDNLVEMVTSDPQLMIFAYKLGKISKRPEGYTNPTEHWQIGDIRNDLADATGRVGRKEFFTEFIENAEQVFGKMVNGKLTGDNINKIEAIYGSNFREALEDILHATYTGSSRPHGSNRMVNNFTNWINGSVGATMFVNMRSALLQQMSSVNFLNWGDNNIFKAGLAFANFPQYIKDWAMIFNSDKLKQRRSGLSMDINANELATYLGKSKSKPAALLSWLLQKGFLPTQVSDSIAIANGGAGFYRNRVNTYLKQGFKQKEAEEKAWNDFSEIAEETQQSARPDMVSQQQRSPIGKWFLNFLNTPMQYSRIMKKAMLDLVNRRGDAKTHISRIIYYGAAQNAIFYTLQTGLFAAMFDDDDEEAQKFFDTKAQMTANSMVDGLLKGLGFGGAAISTVKNMIIKFIEEDRKGYKGKPAKKVTLEMVNFSPVVGIKVRKISSAIDRYSWDKELVKEMETFDIDNPIWGISTGIIEGATNVPLNRLYRKVQNVRAATDADREAWQRLALVSGWSVWNIGEQNKELEKLKDEIKARKKKSQKSKSKKKKNRFGPRIL